MSVTRLELFRRTIGFSQIELAKRAGYSNKTISNYERGKSAKPSNKFKKAVSEALGVTKEVLFPD